MPVPEIPEQGHQPRTLSARGDPQTQDETDNPCMTALAKRSLIKFYCSTCDQKLSVPAGLEGQKFSCPNCAAPGHVPGKPPREHGLNGEAVIKFFCLHCGQKLSCESGAEGKAARCPVCGESTPVPESSGSTSKIAGDLRLKQTPSALNGKWREEPEVVLGPDPEKNGYPKGAAQGASSAKSPRDPKTRAPDVADPPWEGGGAGSAPDDLNGAALETPEKRYVMGSVSPEELFESLQDLGFEVEQLSVPPKKDDREAAGE